MPGPSRPHLPYQPALDGLRALAALAVVAFHARVPFSPGVFFGVDVFFVLSGYLITRLLLLEHQATGRIRFVAFSVRRLRRLYPALLAMLVVAGVPAWWMFEDLSWRAIVSDLALSATYMADLSQMFGHEGRLHFLFHTWTLGVEEKFYLVWPLLLMGLLWAGKGRGLGWALGILFVALTVWRGFQMLEAPHYWDVYTRFDTHSSGLILGCWLGVVRPKGRWWVGWVGLIVLVCLTSQLYFKAWESAQWGFTAAEVATAMVLMSAPAWLGWGPLAWVGKLSYGWYLWHYPIIRYMRHEGFGWVEMVLVGGGLSLAMAALSYFTIEACFRKKASVGKVAPADGTDGPVGSTAPP